MRPPCSRGPSLVPINSLIRMITSPKDPMWTVLTAPSPMRKLKQSIGRILPIRPGSHRKSAASSLMLSII